MLYVEPERQDGVRAALDRFRELPFALVPHGTRVLLHAESGSGGPGDSLAAG
jgi:hypothetical protein